MSLRHIILLSDVGLVGTLILVDSVYQLSKPYCSAADLKSVVEFINVN